MHGWVHACMHALCVSKFVWTFGQENCTNIQTDLTYRYLSYVAELEVLVVVVVIICKINYVCHL